MYLVWRKLGISIDDWVNLPWWQQQVVIDGMEWEAKQNSEDGDSDGDEADITDMERFEALTKTGSTKRKGFGLPPPKQ